MILIAFNIYITYNTTYYISVLKCSARLPAPEAQPDPALHGTTEMSTPRTPLGPGSAWDHQIHAPLVFLPFRPAGLPAPWAHQAPALHTCWIATAPGPHRAGHHRKAPNLPKRHRQTGKDSKGVTSEQGRL
jgi:hypothetical protein